MDEQLLQLPISQLSTIVVAFDVVQIGSQKQAINLRTNLDITQPKRALRKGRQ
jgi:hypothetical protein